MSTIADGWTLSTRHTFAPPYSSTLHKGDGTVTENTITTIQTGAGNGAQGYSGDGGPANQAMLNSPWGVAVDSAGNLYIADSFNNRIRKVDTNGIITTVAGNGTYGYTSDGGDGGPATDAEIFWPRSVALDAEGNLYIAEPFYNRIRKAGTSGRL